MHEPSNALPTPARTSGAAARRAHDLPGFVRYADRVGAGFTVDVTTAAELRAVLEAIGGGRRFDPSAAADALGPHVAHVMHARVERPAGEAPTLRLRLPFDAGQRICAVDEPQAARRRYTVAERQETALLLHRAAIAAGADEVHAGQGCGATAVSDGVGADPCDISIRWS